MPNLPSGLTQNNNPLSAIETSVILGVQQWVKMNDEYVKKSSIITSLLIAGSSIWLIDVVLQTGFFFAASVICLIIAFLMKKNLKTKLINFPIPIIAEHDWVSFRATPHLHSTSNFTQLVASIKSEIPKYQIHSPKIPDDEDVSQRGIREHSSISKNTLSVYFAEVSKYKTEISSTKIDTFNLQVLTGDGAQQLAVMLKPLTNEQIHLCADIQVQNQSDHTFTETQNSLAKLEKIIDYNRILRTQFLGDSKADIARYHNWKDMLNSISQNWSETVLTSAEMGWENMAEASSNASEFLEIAVQSRLDDLKAKVVSEAIEAKNNLESQMKEIETEIAHKEEGLNTQIIAQQAVVAMANRTNSTLSNYHVSPTITIQIPVAEVSGGGGNIGQQGGYVSGVSTSIRYESVNFDNPAHQIKEQILELANSTYQIEQVRLDSLKKQISALTNIINSRREQIDERRKKKEEEIDERLAREKLVTLKHANSVESLFLNIQENGEKVDYSDLLRLVKTSWNRPSELVSKLTTPIDSMIEDIETMMEHFENGFQQIEQMLIPSSVSQYSGQKIYSHWVFSNNALIETDVKANIIEVYQHDQVYPVPSNKGSLLPITVDNNLLIPISKNQFSQTLKLLILKNSFGPKLTKILSKLEPNQIVAFQNTINQTRTGVI